MFETEEKEKRPEGEVIEVIERNKMDFVGVIDIQKNFSFVSTANQRCIPIFYSKDRIGDAEQGDVVLVAYRDTGIKRPIVPSVK
jgi:ribonuclease R